MTDSSPHRKLDSSGELDVVPIEDVLKDCRQYYRAQKRRIKDELRHLPAKGSVCRRKIKGHIYYYLVYRDENSKFISNYMGREEPKELKAQIERRRYLLKQLKKIQGSMFVLGLARRKGTFSKAMRFEVLSRDNFTCQYCGRSVKEHNVALNVDHIVPKKQGGTDALSNLITSCFDCNIGKHKHIADKST